MTHEQAPEIIVALYDQLADAEAALHDLQAAGVDYAVIQLEARDASEYAAGFRQTPPLSGNVWSLSIPAEAGESDEAQAALGDHDPLAVGRAPAAHKGRNEVEQGAIAWQRYRFDGPAGTDQIADAAGTTGTTGIISSGVFADQDDEHTQ